MKFEVGDKVGIINNPTGMGHKLGDTGFILEYESHLYKVDVEGDIGSYFGSELELIKSVNHIDEILNENPDLMEKLAVAEEEEKGASKNDKADMKPDYSIIPKVVMDQLSYVMMAGQEKYGRHNYTKGHNITQLTAAVCRHAKQIESGEDIDKDTSERIGKDIYHWACIMASGLMAIHQMELGTLKDDRFKPPLLEFED